LLAGGTGWTSAAFLAAEIVEFASTFRAAALSGAFAIVGYFCAAVV